VLHLIGRIGALNRDHHRGRHSLGTPGATNMVRIAFVGGDSAGEAKRHGAGNRPAPATYAPQRYPSCRS
jgi:hypothetical protein